MSNQSPHQWKSTLFNRIATDLCDPHKVREAIEQKKYRQRSETDVNFAAPRNLIEQKLAEIWTELLGIEEVGIYDNFFMSGGNSILATQLLSRVYDQWGWEMSLRSMFEYPNIAAFALHLIETSVNPPAQRIIRQIKRRGQESPISASYAQQRLWFLDHLESGNASYHLLSGVRLRGLLDTEILAKSFAEVVSRHEILRTRFVTINGLLMQVIDNSSAVSMPVNDLSQFDRPSAESQMLRLAGEEARRQFDLSAGPLFRLRLLRLDRVEHVLLLTMHHIISDWWSIGVLVEEVATLYAAFSRGEHSPLAELPIQYADYAVWQREWLEGGEMERLVAYWRERLAGAPALLELPTDRPRPIIERHCGARLRVEVNEELTNGLRAFSEREGVTLFISLLAVFAVLLNRYSGQMDLCVGTPVANRNHIQTEQLIGFFVNTLVLRMDLSGDPNFRQLIGRIQERVLEDLVHQDLPFEKLVEEMQPKRGLSYTPLFQVVIALRNFMRWEPSLAGLKSELLEIKSRSAKFDLLLDLIERKERLGGVIEYNTDLFEASRIERLWGHYEVLLQAILADPTRRISQLPLLTEAERQCLFLEWNGEQVTPRPDSCIHYRFEDQVERTPDAIAVNCQNEALSYRVLNQNANRLASYLRKMGVGPEVKVAMFLDRSVNLVIGVLGTIKAGGAYVPIEINSPKQRIAYILEDAQSPVLLSQQWLIEELPELQADIVCLDAVGETFAAESGENPNNWVFPENQAYVIYTSGSTGRPKGVSITHSNVVRLFDHTQQWFCFNKDDVWSLFHSYAFDFSVWELWGALLYGGRLTIVPYWVSRTADAFYDMLDEERVTVLNQTPSAFRQLIRREEEMETVHRLALRSVIFGGEALDLQSLRPWFKRHGDQLTQLVNMYGITETTVHVTYRPLVSADLTDSYRSVIGRGIPDLRLYLLDQFLLPVPIGAKGEMIIGGGGVSVGYLNRSELTAERFIPDPFGHMPGERLYRSGDLARYSANGDLEYLERIDNQVKIRGFRIELGEIQTALASHPAVREAAVVVQDEEADHKHLIAYVVLSQDPVISINELQRHLTERLPDYMVPSVFVKLEAFPLTANGKLDWQSLPDPAGMRPDLETKYVPPGTIEEEILASIWSQVLNIEEVGIDDGFFALGGDSIRSIEIVSKAQEKGLRVSVQQLFKYQTIRDLAEELKIVESSSEAMTLSGGVSLISDQDFKKLPEEVEDAYPLTALQAVMLFHSAYTPDSATYHDIFSYHLQAPLDLRLFNEIVKNLISRHPVLRASFDLANYSEPLQLIQREVIAPLHIEDLQHLAPAEQEKELLAWMKAEAGVKFDWTRAPLLRFYIHRRCDKTFQFTLSFHHAILDGWSVASMLTELFQLYLRFQGREDLAIESPPQVFHRDYVALERASLASGSARNYWEQKLRDLTATILPVWPSSQPAAELPSVRLQRVFIPEETSGKVKKLARSIGVPIRSILLATHLKVIGFLTGQTDIISGMAFNGRPERRDGERTLGLFLNTLPFRLKISGGTWTDLIRQVFETEREILPYRWYSMAQIQRDFGGEPLFNTMFGFFHFHVYKGLREFNNLEVLDRWEIEQTNVALMANFSIDPFSTQLQLNLSCNTTELSSEQLSEIATYYEKALSLLTSNPTGRYDIQPLLSIPEEHQRVIEWNDTCESAHQDAFFQKLFESQVARMSDALAMVCGDEQMSYGELNRRANQLADYLRRVGVGPEVRVALCFERSLQLGVALVGVLKAGGAYVPLDINNPLARRNYMLADSQAKVLLTKGGAQDQGLTSGIAMVNLDAEQPIIAGMSGTNPITDISGCNLAYLIYTSGSTGQPKGVMVTHQGLVNYLSWAAQVYCVGERRHVPVHSSVSFDLTVTSMLLPLMVGDCIHWIPESAGGEVLATALKSGGVFNLVKLTPTHLELLTRNCSDKSIEANIGTFIIGGEALKSETLGFWRTHTSVPRLINEYGPTETVVGCCTYEVTPDSCYTGMLPIGRPISNTQAYVLDTFNNAVPLGVAGELFIGGVGVARGYWQRPDLTAEKFIPDLFNLVPGGRLYQTGDMCRYKPDGIIEYIGRRDLQVKVRGFRIELGEIEAELVRHPDVNDAIVLAREDVPGDRRLVAYITPSRTNAISSLQLRDFLQAQLPAYMIPSIFVCLNSLPLNHNGKVDRQALPAPDRDRPELKKNFIAPQTPIEELLANIWAEVLRLDSIGIHDNFFELGGDSILGIQILARAYQQGVQLLPKELFQFPTIAEQAALVSGNRVASHDQEEVTGSVELTPIQNWFFEQKQPDSHHFNQAVLLSVKLQLVPDHLERVARKLMQHHDALRMRFKFESSKWQQTNIAGDSPSPFTLVDLSMLVEEMQHAAFNAVASEMQASLNLTDGPIWRVILFDFGSERPQRLLLIVHHLVIDGISWRILLEDLQIAYLQLSQGKMIELTKKTTSFKQWSARLMEYARSQVLESEIDYWRSVSKTPTFRLPVDYISEENTVISARTISVSLNTNETRVLLYEVPRLYHTQINDVLLAALAQAFARREIDGTLVIDLEGHGREPLFEDLDLSRTVGWFTTHFPVTLELARYSDPVSALKSSKDYLRSIPNRGIGYGMLQYLSGKTGTREQLWVGNTREVSFNYLGQLDQVLSNSLLFEVTPDTSGQRRSPRGNRSHLLEISGSVLQDQLSMTWTYSENIHRRSTIELLAEDFLEALRSIIAHCRTDRTLSYTPSDFPLASLTQQALDRVVGRGMEIEDLYPLSPIQQGLLFHSLYEPQLPVYVTQYTCVLDGHMDVTAFQQAWQHAVDRHPILRTSFVWEGLDDPVQVVNRQTRLSWEEKDWRRLPPEEQREMLESFIHADRNESFDLSQAPLMRFALIQLNDNVYQFVWSFHHLLIDGWSGHLLFKDVFAFYQAIAHGQILKLNPVHSYRDFIAWLQRQDMKSAETYWRRELDGFTKPSLLTFGRMSHDQIVSGEDYFMHQLQLSKEETFNLQAFCRQYRLTMNTLVQGVWALLLSHFGCGKELVYGVTVSGRPIELSGVESIIGPFINTLPMRVIVQPDALFLPWLAKLQSHQVEMSQYQHSPLIKIREWSRITHPLFESIFVFENYPLDSVREGYGGIEIRQLSGYIRNNFPLTLRVVPGDAIAMQILHDCRRFDSVSINQLLGGLEDLLLGAVQQPSATLEKLTDILKAAYPQQRLIKPTVFKETRRQKLGRIGRRKE